MFTYYLTLHYVLPDKNIDNVNCRFTKICQTLMRRRKSIASVLILKFQYLKKYNIEQLETLLKTLHGAILSIVTIYVASLNR